MSPDEKSPVGIEALNDAIKEVGTAYDLLAKAAGLSDPEFWSLDLIWHGAQTQREIAERLRISVKTVENHMTAALGQLRRLLASITLFF